MADAKTFWIVFVTLTAIFFWVSAFNEIGLMRGHWECLENEIVKEHTIDIQQALVIYTAYSNNDTASSNCYITERTSKGVIIECEITYSRCKYPEVWVKNE